MSNLRQAAEQALEALENLYATLSPESVLAISLNHRITALRAALAEPHDPVAYDGWVLRKVLFDNGEPVGHRAPEQEPVAWQWLNTANFRKKIPADATPAHWRPLYTAPPQRKPLTNKEIKVIEEGIWKSEFFDATERQANREFTRAIEAAHGIKGEA